MEHGEVFALVDVPTASEDPHGLVEIGKALAHDAVRLRVKGVVHAVIPELGVGFGEAGVFPNETDEELDEVELLDGLGVERSCRR